MNSVSIVFPVKKIPSYIRTTAKSLIDKGFKAYLVGGAVRDLFLERRPKDYDLATNAVPEEIEKIFSKTVLTGAKFGSVLVVTEDEYGEARDVDVTTFRKEEGYFGGRWPSKVEYGTTIEEDLSRRDFTINAMAIDMEMVLEDADQYLEVDRIIDPYQGIGDLLDRTIRAVRNPLERFQEDGLRAYKACRLVAELNFDIEETTKQAIRDSLSVAAMISKERIRDEIVKMVKHAKRPSIGIKIMDETGLLELIIPELVENKGIVQPDWHNEDVFEHSLKAMDIAEDSIKLAALLHDVGKARTRSVDEEGKIHFFGHDQVGADMVVEIMQRLRFSNIEIERVSNLVRWHMFYYPSADWRKENEITLAEEDHGDTNLKHGWSDGGIRRFLNKIGGIDQLNDLIKLRIADAGANKKTAFNPIEIQVLQDRVAEVLAQDAAMKISDLTLNGHDLMEMGFKHGKQIGEILTYLLDEVIENPILNSREELKRLVFEKYGSLKN